MLEKIKQNKALKIIYNIIYAILFILVLIILLVVVLQKVSNNTLSLGGFKLFNIVSESMIPKYQIGDILLAKETDVNDIKVGDDVVYMGNTGSFTGKIVTHQVIGIDEAEGKKQFHTKGLANEEEDPIVSEEQIQGVIVYKMQSLSFIAKIVNNLYGAYFVIFVPIVLIIFVELRKLILNKREEDDDEDDEEDDSEEENDEEEDNKQEKE